jgi:uncharacterized membrane protein YgdD (TMEM256/DUF423 family)
MIHSVVLLVTSLSPTIRNKNMIGGGLCLGMLLFSGSLYTLVLTEYKKLGIIAPIGIILFFLIIIKKIIGGVLLITSWFLIAFSI